MLKILPVPDGEIDEEDRRQLVDLEKTPKADWRFVDPDTLPADWPKYRQMVNLALGRGDGCFAERDVLAQLLVGKWHLLASGGHLPNAVAVIEVVNFPRQRVLFLRYAAGKKEAILAGNQFLEDEARAAGCTAIETYGRRGWESLLPDWEFKRVILRKDLKP